MAGPLPFEQLDEQDDNPLEGALEKFDEDESDVTDTDDGGAIVKLKDKSDSQPQESLAFYDNLASNPKILDQAGLARIDQLLRTAIEQDQQVRKKRDDDYADGIQRTGIGDDAPGGANFPGASKAVHPVLSKAAVDFEARTILELFPSGGPVKAFTVGTVTQQRADKAERLAKHMNWQLTKKMPECRSELEQMLSQVPLSGSQFMYGCWDEQLKRPRFTYWPSDHVYVPYAASSMISAERVTMVEHITQRVYEQRVASKFYTEPVTPASATMPEETAAAEAAAKGEGKEADPYNTDGLRPMWRCFTYLDLEGKDPKSKDGPAPYIVEMDANVAGSVKRVTRNWREFDETRDTIRWLIEFPFLPWRGAMSVGLGQAIGKLGGAATGALRAILDAAHVNNFPGMAKLKGANVVGQAQNVDIGTVVEFEGSFPGQDNDIRKLLMTMPYNPPSQMLAEMLGVIVKECENFVQTSMRNITEDNISQLPVGTALSAIEEGLRTLNAVHARLHFAMGHMLELLFRLNALYIDEQELKDETGEVLATKRDYQGPMDVQPVSDPNVFSEAQRYAQMQLVSQRADQMTALGIAMYDRRAVEEMILKRARIPDYDRLLLPAQVAQPNNAVNENVALSLGRPAAAFPEQDHLAHLQVHLDYMNSPFLGMLPTIAPKFLAGVLQHISEHIAMWYVSEVYRQASAAVKATGHAEDLTELMDAKSHEVSAELDRLLATVSTDVIQQAGQLFNQFPQIIQKAQQTLQQLSPQMPQDPTLAAKQMDVQAKGQSDQSAERRAQVTAQSAAQRAQIGAASAEKRDSAKAQLEAMKAKLAAQKGEQDNVVKMRSAEMKEAGDTQREREKQASAERINTADNTTALEIAAAEIAQGERTSLSTGTGINPSGGK